MALKTLWGKEKMLVYQAFLSFSQITLTLNPFSNKPWFLSVCSTSLLKTLREKKKLLVQFLHFPQCGKRENAADPTVNNFEQEGF